MPRPRAAIDATCARDRLDALRTPVRGEAEGAEAELLDDAKVAAVAGADQLPTTVHNRASTV